MKKSIPYIISALVATGLLLLPKKSRASVLGLSLSNGAKNLLKKLEGLILIAKPDGKLNSIGYGHTASDIADGQTITKADAEAILINDIAIQETAIKKLVKVPLTQNEFDALVLFVFNIGQTAFKNSTLLRKLNAGNYKAASGEFEKWTKFQGEYLPALINRRKIERKLFVR